VARKPSTDASTTSTELVEYDNPNTGTHSDYELDVDRDSDGTIERINFPNGGWREVDGDVERNPDGSETYTSSDGIMYTVHPEGGGGTGTSDEDENTSDDRD
jgi:hypothetical protein